MSTSNSKNNKKNNKFRKGKWANQKRKPAEKAEERNTEKTTDTLNDVSWYTRYPELSVATASLPYPNRPGMALLVDPQTPGNTLPTDKYAIPGVMSLEWMPSIGQSSTPTDPASLVGREMFTRVRKTFSGSSLAADGPDFVMYVLALDSIFSYIASLKRLYRTLNAYTPNNYNMPDQLLRAMGVPTQADMVTLRNEKMQLWQYINELVSMTKKFMLPAEFHVINRHYWMNDHVYADADTLASQLYLYVQTGFYKFQMINDPQGNPAPGVAITSYGYTWTAANLFRFGRDLIDALSGWDDCFTINGYIQKAYEGSPVFAVDLIPQEELEVPVYEPEVLMQIENSMTINTNIISGSNDVSQDPLTNSVLCAPRYHENILGADPYRDVRHFISIRSPMPTVADTLIATRMHVWHEPVNPGTPMNTEAYILCCTEIPLKWRFWGKIWDQSTQALIDYSNDLAQYRTIFSSSGNVAQLSVEDLLNDTSRIAAFDWHPQFWVMYQDNTAVSRTYIPFFDVHNITDLDTEQMKQIHRVCMLSEWNAYEA